MRMIDIIEKKKNKLSLSDEDIKFWIKGVTNGDIPDYQTSALLMAIVLNGMDNEETTSLTDAMMNSGDILDLSKINGVKVDKHSTGGVGDKTTLVIGPIVSSCGLKVAKMSGRGLGHTGGTIDKLESIRGFNVNLSEVDFINQVEDIGISIIGQTDKLVPADKILYALRDATATVDSIPLIASSIMSKKLALGSDTILLDVKYGDGAFMKTIEDARKLSDMMTEIGSILGRNTVAIISDMNQPLGNTIGNALEVEEAVEALKGNGDRDFLNLCKEACEIMLIQGGVAENKDEAGIMVEESIKSGRALEKFIQMVQYQGGDIEQIKDTALLPKSMYITEIRAKADGHIDFIQAKKLGIAAMKLGAGRKSKEDNIDYSVGLKLLKKKGDDVRVGEIICEVHHNENLSEELKEDIYNSFSFYRLLRKNIFS